MFKYSMSGYLRQYHAETTYRDISFTQRHIRAEKGVEMFYGCDFCEPKEDEKKGIFQRKQSNNIIFVGDFACKLCVDCHNRVDRWIVELPEWLAYNDLFQRKAILANSLTGRVDYEGERSLKQLMETLNAKSKELNVVISNFFEMNRPVATPQKKRT